MTSIGLLWFVIYFYFKAKIAECSYCAEENTCDYEENELTCDSLNSEVFNDPSFLTDLSSFVSEQLKNYSTDSTEENVISHACDHNKLSFIPTYADLNNANYSENQDKAAKNTIKQNRDYESASYAPRKIRKTDIDKQAIAEYNTHNVNNFVSTFPTLMDNAYHFDENSASSLNNYQSEGSLKCNLTNFQSMHETEGITAPLEPILSQCIISPIQERLTNEDLLLHVVQTHNNFINAQDKKACKSAPLVPPNDTILNEVLYTPVQTLNKSETTQHITEPILKYSIYPLIQAEYKPLIRSHIADGVAPNAISNKNQIPYDPLPEKQLAVTILIDFINNVLYYRYNITIFFSFFFSRYSNVHQKYDNTLCSAFLSILIKSSLEFASENHQKIIKIVEDDEKLVNYEYFKVDEQKLINEFIKHSNSRDYASLKNEISRIRHFNKEAVRQKSQLLRFTSFKKFKKSITMLFGWRYNVEYVLYMFLYTFKPLYNLSLIFDRQENKLLHDFLKESKHMHSESCKYDQNVTEHHLFHWAFYWGFSLSNYGLIDYFYYKSFKKDNSKKLPLLFFAQCIIIIHSFVNYDKQIIPLYLDNVFFLKIYSNNVLVLLTENTEEFDFTSLEQQILQLIDVIEHIYEPKYLLAPRPDYLRLQRSSIDSKHIANSLTEITKSLIQEFLFIAQSAYHKTEQFFNDTV